jgi:hypothetical protein
MIYGNNSRIYRTSIVSINTRREIRGEADDLMTRIERVNQWNFIGFTFPYLLFEWMYRMWLRATSMHIYWETEKLIKKKGNYFFNYLWRFVLLKRSQLGKPTQELVNTTRMNFLVVGILMPIFWEKKLNCDNSWIHIWGQKRKRKLIHNLS